MKITRRHLMTGAAGAGIIAAGVGIHSFSWNQRDFTRRGYLEGAPEAPPGKASWMNWAGIERATPDEISFPDTVEALAEKCAARKAVYGLLAAGILSPALRRQTTR